MKIFVDDIREPPDRSWVVFRDMEVAVTFVIDAIYKHIFIECISLDHDMGIKSKEVEYMNGYQFLIKLEEFFFRRYENDLANNVKSTITPPKIIIHSANSVGVARMQTVITSIKRYVR